MSLLISVFMFSRSHCNSAHIGVSGNKTYIAEPVIIRNICYVAGVTRKKSGNQNLVFGMSAKSIFKI